MDFIEITADNINAYFTIDDRWFIDDLRRGRFLGLAAMDGEEKVGELAYTVRRNEEGEGCFGVLHYLNGTEAAMETLLEELFRRFAGFEVSRVFVETPVKEVAEFLQTHGFAMEEGESIVITFELGDIADSPVLKTKIPPTIRALSDVSPLEFRYFIRTYSDRLNTIPFYDIESTPVERYDPDVSCVSVTKEGIDAAFLLEYDASEETLYAEVFGGVGEGSSKKVPFLAIFAAAAAVKKLPPNTKVFISHRNQKIANLTNKLFEGLKGEKTWHGTLEVTV